MTHGTVGNFDINLPLDLPSAIEPRRAGGANGPGNYTIIYTFERTITSPGTASSNDADATETVQSAGNQVTVTLTGVDNAQNLEVTLDNVQDSAGANLTGVKARMGVLLGDSNTSRRTDSGDVTFIRNQTVAAPTQSNFRLDVNTSGRIDSGHVTVARNASVSVLP